MMGYANTKYKTEKRKANVGERILITDKYPSEKRYENGNVFTVTRAWDDNDVHAGGTYVLYQEYEVIVVETPPKPSKNERISLLESQVAELQAKVEALEFSKQSADAGATIRETLAKLAKEYTDSIPKMLTSNEQRKAVIERAKAFVADTQRKMVDNNFTSEGNEFLSYWMTKVEFVVNAEKRTVVAIMRNYKTNAILTKAIAKCAPDDVFNADIGKAIALGRALGLDVSEFENAVKPTEVVVGHKFTGIKYGLTYTASDVREYDGARRIFMEEKPTCNYTVDKYVASILDDTEAQY